MNRLFDLLFSLWQYVIPQHGLTSLVYRFTRVRISWVKNLQIQIFIKFFSVNMLETMQPSPLEYETFNAFFTRKLKTDARTWRSNSNNIISPVDGAISQIGQISKDRIIQAKGKDYSLKQLLADDDVLLKRFESGSFATLYLSPKDYHRIHMPINGTLLKSIFVPGKLFSVNNPTVRTVDSLFARNERFVSVFDTEQGQFALIMVGALFVGSMSTVFTGQITPTKKRQVYAREYSQQEQILLKQGDEFGFFNMGSTVILLFENNRINWLEELSPQNNIKVGQIIGNLVT